MATLQIRDRIVELRRVKARDLLPNPKNWRRHSKPQMAALKGMLTEVGYAGALLAYETADGLQLIDGHARAQLTPDMEVPVLVTDLTPAEADKVLATLDPLSAMADIDHDALSALLADVSIGDAAVNTMLEALANGENQPMPDLSDYPALPEGDKSDIGQMTFTVTEMQRLIIEDALAAAKRMGSFGDTANENSNGNALAHICGAFMATNG